MPLTDAEIEKEYILPLRLKHNNMFVEALAYYVLSGATYGQISSGGASPFENLTAQLMRGTNDEIIRRNASLMNARIQEWLRDADSSPLKLTHLDDDGRVRLLALEKVFSPDNVQKMLDKKHGVKPVVKTEEQEKRPQIYRLSEPESRNKQSPRKPITTTPSVSPEQIEIKQKNEAILKLLVVRQTELGRPPQVSAGVFGKAKTLLKDAITGAENRKFAINKIIERVNADYFGANPKKSVIDLNSVITEIQKELNSKEKEKFNKGISEVTSGKSTKENFGYSKFAHMQLEIKEIASGKKKSGPTFK